MFTTFSDLSVGDRIYVITSDYTPMILKITNIVSGDNKIDLIETNELRFLVEYDAWSRFEYGVWAFADKHAFVQHLALKIKELNDMCIKFAF